jgi:hypothetical protein
MNSLNITLFSQIINIISRKKFNELVIKHKTDAYIKRINTWSHFVLMMLCQFLSVGSIREIVNILNLNRNDLNHLGIQTSPPCKSEISYLNKTRDSRFFEDLYYAIYDDLMTRLEDKKIIPKRLEIKLKEYSLDSTTITLCERVFNWATYRRHKGAIKLHTLLENNVCLPEYVHISKGNLSDNKIAFNVKLPKGSIVMADRGYFDTKLLGKWNKEEIKFVVRMKDNTKIVEFRERELPVGKNEHILKDREIIFENKELNEQYSKEGNNFEKLRLITIYNEKGNYTLELLTNNFLWTAEDIAELYVRRWKVETFFSDIKRNLKIKTFIGTSANAVSIQIWTALIVILLTKYFILLSQNKYKWCLSNLIGVFKAMLMTKINLSYIMTGPAKPEKSIILPEISLFDG